MGTRYTRQNASQADSASRLADNSMPHGGRRSARLLAALLLLCLPLPGGSDTASPELRLMAAYLYNFTSFVSWPDGAQAGDGFTLCVLGEDPFGKLLDGLAGRAVKDTRLVVRRLHGPEQLDQCRLVFFGVTGTARTQAALARLAGLPVLTVSDVRGFTRLGGIIEFTTGAERVGFAINNAAAEAAGLGISSKLLNLASPVRQED